MGLINRMTLFIGGANEVYVLVNTYCASEWDICRVFPRLQCSRSYASLFLFLAKIWCAACSIPQSYVARLGCNGCEFAVSYYCGGP